MLTTHFPTYSSNASLEAVVTRLARWQRNARSRAALARLGPQHLEDVGIDRRMARREAARPFWAD